MTTRQAEILASLPQSVQFTAGDLQAQLGSVTMRHVRRQLRAHREDPEVPTDG